MRSLRSIRAARLVHLGGVVCSLSYGWLAYLSRQDADVDLTWYFVVIGGAWAATLSVFFALRHPEAVFRWKPIFVWALVFRGIGFVGEPVLEDDFYRYLWDGRSFALTGNPYRDSPMDHFLDPDLPESFEEILDNINNPEIPTIYGPVNQFAFLASYLLAPGKLWPFKLLLLLSDLVTLAILLRLSTGVNLVLYAWCPLLIQETFFTAHPDSLGIALLLAALVASSGKRHYSAVVLLGLAVGARVFALLLVPYLLLRSPRKTWPLFGAAALSLYLPFWLMGSSGSAGAMGVFLQDWEFNSSGYAILSAVFAAPIAKGIAAILFGALYLAGLRRWWRNGADEMPRGDWIYGLFFLLSPVLNPWYLLWLLPFAVLFPSRWAVTALVVMSASYVHGLHLLGTGLPSYHHPPWLRPLEFGSIALAGACDYLLRRYLKKET